MTDPEGRTEHGLDGPIPDGQATPYQFGSGVECREHPHRYLTDWYHRISDLWELRHHGSQPRSDGVLHWPRRLVISLRAIDRERAAYESHHLKQIQESAKHGTG